MGGQKGRITMTPEATDHLLSVYLVYVSASIGLTIWLARTLFKNGEVFLEEVFADNPRMASAVNRLLVVGFYLLNLGYAFVTLKAGNEVNTRAELMAYDPMLYAIVAGTMRSDDWRPTCPATP